MRFRSIICIGVRASRAPSHVNAFVFGAFVYVQKIVEANYAKYQMHISIYIRERSSAIAQAQFPSSQ